MHNTKYNYSSVFSNSSFLNSCYKHRFENDSHNAGRQPLTREASVSRAGSRPAADCPSAIACAMAEGQKPLRQRQIPSAFPLVWFPLVLTFGFWTWGCKLHCGLYLLLCPCGWVAFSPWRDKAGCCVLFGASAKQDLVGGGTKQALPQGIQERVSGKFWQNLPNFPLSAVSCPQRSADGAFSLPTMLGSAGCVFRLGKLKQGSRRPGEASDGAIRRQARLPAWVRNGR